jgi:FeS assembly protein IscX
MPLTWEDNDEIAEALVNRYPEMDPLGMSFPHLHRMIVELDDFSDDPEAVTEHQLEKIQMAWYNLVEDE